MILLPPISTPLYSSAASDVYKRQGIGRIRRSFQGNEAPQQSVDIDVVLRLAKDADNRALLARGDVALGVRILPQREWIGRQGSQRALGLEKQVLVAHALRLEACL